VVFVGGALQGHFFFDWPLSCVAALQPIFGRNIQGSGFGVDRCSPPAGLRAWKPQFLLPALDFFLPSGPEWPSIRQSHPRCAVAYKRFLPPFFPNQEPQTPLEFFPFAVPHSSTRGDSSLNLSRITLSPHLFNAGGGARSRRCA